MTSDLPLVSIITPVYNGAVYIEELILSVQEQDYPNIEHIIIDDGSQDDGATVAILKRYPHLRWWSRENRGQYATMNEGLKMANGEFFCFVSADDLVIQGAVRRVVESMQQHPEYDGIAGLTQFIDGTGAPYPIKFPFQTAPIRYYVYFSHIAHCSIYLKRARVLELNLFFEPSIRHVSDYDWILRVLARLILYRASFYLSKYRIHEAQTTAQYRQTMAEKCRRIAISHHFNPVLYQAYTGLYIIVHDFIKLRYAWQKNGIAGAWELVTHKFQKISNQNR
jgi:glycosyltransferase involved in cell wall biosynthesis